jgi:hypothetical protein
LATFNQSGEKLPSCMWHVDSGACEHIVCTFTLLHHYTPFQEMRSIEVCAEGTQLHAHGAGIVKMFLESGSVLDIHNV